jgi:hypothetical protein
MLGFADFCGKQKNRGARKMTILVSTVAQPSDVIVMLQ